MSLPVLSMRVDSGMSGSGGRAPGRFSTIVENSVENSGLSELASEKSLVVSGSAYGEGRFARNFLDVFRRGIDGSAVPYTAAKAKVSYFHSLSSARTLIGFEGAVA